MPAQQRYIRSILSTFATFLANADVDRLAQESGIPETRLNIAVQELLVEFLRWKSDYLTWSAEEIEQFSQENSLSAVALTTLPLLIQFINEYPPYQTNVFLQEFLLALKKDGCSNSTIKNYRSDISQFIDFCEEIEIESLLTKTKLDNFYRFQKEKRLKDSTIKRKFSSIVQFGIWMKTEGILTKVPSWLRAGYVYEALEKEQSWTAGEVLTPSSLPQDEAKLRTSLARERSENVKHAQKKPTTPSGVVDGGLFLNKNKKASSDLILKPIVTKNGKVVKTARQLQGSWTAGDSNPFTQNDKSKFGPTAAHDSLNINKKTDINRIKKPTAPTGTVGNGGSFFDFKNVTNSDLSLLNILSKKSSLVNPKAQVKSTTSTPGKRNLLSLAKLPVSSIEAHPASGSPLKHQEKRAQLKSSLGGLSEQIRTRITDTFEQVKQKASLNILPYVNLALIILFFLGLGSLGYSQLITNAPYNLAYSTQPTPPGRTLSFQGRLTDQGLNPIITNTPMTFRLYNVLTGGTPLWTSSGCTVEPDQDGIFAVGLGDLVECGPAIDPSVFSENPNIWLEVQVDTETLAPRQPIRTVAYALNAETLQGYPLAPTGGAGANTVLTMNNDSNVLFAEAVVLQTVAGSNADIKLAADGTGLVNLDDLLYVSSSAGGVGIGTTNPGSAMLAVMTGNVGVGTNTPNANLQVAGTFSLTSGATVDNIRTAVRAVGVADDTSLVTEAAIASAVGSAASKWDVSSGYLIPNSTHADNVAVPSGKFAVGYSSVGASGVAAFNGNVGVGTAMPSQLLHVSDTLGTSEGVFNRVEDTGTSQDAYFGVYRYASGNAYGMIGFAGVPNGNNYAFLGNSSNTYFNAPSGGSMFFRINQVDRVTINSAGNIGISTTSPTRILGIGGNSARNIGMERHTTANTAGNSLTLNAGGATSGATDKTGGNLILTSGISTGTGSSNIYMQTVTAGTSGTTDRTPSTKMTILGDGNVGIGITNPTARLNLISPSTANGAVAQQWAYSEATNATNNLMLKQITSTGNVAWGFDQTNDGTGYSDVLVMSRGNVGIGTTTPSQLFHVNGGTGIVGQFSGRVIGGDAVEDNEFITLSQLISGTGQYWSRNAVNGHLYPTTIGDNVGIGTTTPGAKLDVTGTGRFSSTLTASDGFTLTTGAFNATATSGAITLSGMSASSLNFGANNVLFTSGNFNTTATGINSTAVGATTASTGRFTTLEATSAGNALTLSGAGANIAFSGAGLAQITTATNQHLALMTGGTGNVGVGTTTPNEKLEVVGNVRFSQALMPAGNAGITNYILTSAGTGSAPIWTNPAGLGVRWNSIANPEDNQSLSMGAHNTTWSWTTGIFSSNWTGNTGISDVYSLTTDASVAGTGTLLNVQTGASTSLSPLRVRAGATEALFVSSGGNVGIGTTEPTNAIDVVRDGLSDIRLRDNFEDKDLIFRNWASQGEIIFDQNVRLEMSPDSTILVAPSTVRIATNSLYRVSVLDNGNVGISTTTPAALFSVGSSSQFRVDSAGDITRIKNLAYSWPTAHVTDGFLHNDGSGNLSWTTSITATNLRWSALLDPVANLSLGMGTYTTDFNWATGTGTSNLFNFTTDASANGTGSLVNIATGAGAAVNPLRVRAGATEALFVSSGGNVGIGTKGPGAKLSLIDNTAGMYIGRADALGGIATGAAFYGDTTTYYGTTGTQSIIFMQGGDERMRILATSGNVGIGTAAPLMKLSVGQASSGNVVSNLHVFNDVVTGAVGSGAEIMLSGISATSRGTKIQGLNTGGSNNAHAMLFFTNAGSSSPIEQMRITSEGNVGIGTTSPSEKLHVNGNIQTSLGYTEKQIVWPGLNIPSYLLIGPIDTTGRALSGVFTGNRSYGSSSTTSFQAQVNFKTAGGNTTFQASADILDQTSLPDDIRLYTVTYNSQTWLALSFTGSTAFFQPDRTAFRGNADNVEILAVEAASVSNVVAYLGNGKQIFESSQSIFAGNVGIGTATPQEKLVVIGNARFGSGATTTQTPDTYVSVSNSNLGESTGFFMYNSTGTTNRRGWLRMNDNTGNMELGMTYGSGSPGLTISTGANVERMRITNGGNVGIGTTSPSLPLHVAGNMRASAYYDTDGGDGYFLDLGNASHGFSMAGQASIGVTSPIATSKVHIEGLQGYTSGNNFAGLLHLYNTEVGSSGDNIGPMITFAGRRGGLDSTRVTYGAIGAVNTETTGNSGGALVFLTKNSVEAAATPTEQMRITVGGNVGIGTANPESSLHIASSSFGHLQLDRSSGGFGSWIISPSNNHTAYSSNDALRFRYDGVDKLSIDSDGAVTTTGGAYFGGNVGIGLTNPITKLGIAGTTQTTFNSFSTYENVAHHYNGAVTTGTIAVCIQNTPNIMLTAEIIVQGYNSVYKYLVRGYTYTGSTTWHQPYASYTGSSNVYHRQDQVRFANNSSGDRCILLGSTTTNWGNHLHASVPRVTVGYGSSSGIGDWSISVITSETGYTNIANPGVNDGRNIFAGSVGIGTTSTPTKLHVGGDGGILATGTYDSGWDGGNLGAGTRMMWIPSKAAFRAGGVTGTIWDSALIANYSTAWGYNSLASGTGSTAWAAAQATGVNSTAVGPNMVVGGNYSFGINLNGSYQSLGSNNTMSIMGGNVGIGTTSPGTTFAVAGLTGTTSGSYLRVYNNNFYYYSSSERYKNNIEPFTDDFTKILKIQPKIFNDNTTGERNIGLIAEDLDSLQLNHLITYKNGMPDTVEYQLVSLYLLEIIKQQQNEIITLAKSIKPNSLGLINVPGNSPSSSALDAITLESLVYSVQDATSNATITRLGNFAEVAIAKINAGLTKTGSLIAENAVITRAKIADLTATTLNSTSATIGNLTANTLQATKATIDELTTRTIKLGNFELKEVDGKLQIINSSQKTVATIDQDGNTQVEGEITAQSVQIEQNSPDSTSPLGELVAQDIQTTNLTATGSTQLAELIADEVVVDNLTVTENLIATGSSQLGELIATNIDAEAVATTNLDVTDQLTAQNSRFDQLEAKIAELDEIKATTASIVSGEFETIQTNSLAGNNLNFDQATIKDVTVSGSLYADVIVGFEEKVAQAFRQPSLLGSLLGTGDEYAQQQQELVEIIESAGYSATNSNQLRQSLADLNLSENEVVITPAAAFVNRYLEVNGSAYIADSLAVNNYLVMGDGLKIAATSTIASIDYVSSSDPASSILYLQSSGIGRVDLMAGLMTIDSSGSVIINGDMWVAGNVGIDGALATNTLLTNLIESNDYDQPTQIRLGAYVDEHGNTIYGEVAGDSTENTQLKQSRLEIIDERGAAVATISATGRAEFTDGLGIGADDLSNETGQEETSVTHKTSGRAKIEAGQEQIIIRSSKVSANSQIFVTPLGSTNNQVLYVKAQVADDSATPDVEGLFIVGFDTPASSDVLFNWWIVN